MPKNAGKYVCEQCDYHTYRLSQSDRHFTTHTHQMIINDNK
jgi:hypothetical protein